MNLSLSPPPKFWRSIFGNIFFCTKIEGADILLPSYLGANVFFEKKTDLILGPPTKKKVAYPRWSDNVSHLKTLCLSPSIVLSISLYLSLSLYLYFSIHLPVSLYISLYLSLSLSISLSPSISLSLSISLYLSLSLYLSISLSLSLSESISITKINFQFS